MKRILTMLTAAALAAALVTGCGSGSGGENRTVRLCEVTHSVFYAPLYAALELGFFADEGLDIDLTNGGGADKVMTAVLAGEADIGLAGPESCIYVLREGREDAPKVFAQLTCRDGSFLLGREKADFSWADLVGKTVIGGRKGGMPEMTLEYVMAENGVIPGEDAVVDTSVQFSMMAGAFTGGKGDYVTLFEPAASQLELEGKGHILASVGQESGEIPYTAFFAAESLLAEDPELIQHFTDAVARGQTWVLSHSPEEIAEAIAPQFPDTQPELLTRVTRRHLDTDVWNSTPVMEPQALDRLQDVMARAGVLEERVAFSRVVDNRFALAVG